MDAVKSNSLQSSFYWKLLFTGFVFTTLNSLCLLASYHYYKLTSCEVEGVRETEKKMWSLCNETMISNRKVISALQVSIIDKEDK